MEPEEIEEHLTSGYWEIAPERRKTRRACAEVLARLPEEIADRIIYRQEVLVWAPGRVLGQCRPYRLFGEFVSVQRPGRRSTIEIPEVKFAFVYLSLELEEQAYPVIVAVVAHEIAHGVSRDIIGNESERRADRQIEDWGFGNELRALRDANPHHRY